MNGSTRPMGIPDPRPEPVGELPRSSDLLVVGAGAMGSWTAHHARAGGGRSVTLLDAFGAGHSRATSGDETRIIRASHGSDRFYTRWSRRARETWLAYGEAWGVPLMLPTGTLWFAAREDGYEARSAEALAAEGVPFERISPQELEAALAADLG